MDAAAGRRQKDIPNELVLLRNFEARGDGPRESLTDTLALSLRQAHLAELDGQAGNPSSPNSYAAARVAL
jgi:hypothetical protein